MQLFVDSADPDEIGRALDTGYVTGVTTSPASLRRSGRQAADVPGVAARAFAHGARELHLQVYGQSEEEIVADARGLVALDESHLPPGGRVVVKIPATPAGFSAAARLGREQVAVHLTAVYAVRQALLAQVVGARYAGFHLGRMREGGLDVFESVRQIQVALAAQHAEVITMAFDVREPAEVERLACLGVRAVSLPLAVLLDLGKSTLSVRTPHGFAEDARAAR